MKRGRPTKEQQEAAKKLKHSVAVVTVFRDVSSLRDLLKENPTYNSDVFELMRPYIKSPRFFDAILHLTADNPELHNKIKKILIESKEE
jgi:hypothetical protein